MFEPTTLQSLGKLRLFQYSLENNWIDPKLIEYHNMIFLKTRKTLYETPDAYNLEKISKISNFFSKVFQSPKIVWNGFYAMKEHSKMIFCWFHFFHLCTMGVITLKILNFFRKFFQVKFDPKIVWNGFCAVKEHSKNNFMLTFIFFEIVYIKIEVKNYLKKTILLNWFFFLYEKATNLSSLFHFIICKSAWKPLQR